MTLPGPIPAAILLICAALFLLWLASRQRRASGIPSGQVLYRDTGGGSRVEKPLYDPISGLTGKPDYLVQENGAIIPVEVKSSRAPSLPYDSHVFQLAAYCMLVERTYGKRPTHGILRYRDRSFSIEYSQALEHELESLLEAIRLQARRAEASRSHQEPARCARCGYRNICNQRL
jgi:CRISPR-associated exonuclease Cas4